MPTVTVRLRIVAATVTMLVLTSAAVVGVVVLSTSALAQTVQGTLDQFRT